MQFGSNPGEETAVSSECPKSRLNETDLVNITHIARSEYIRSSMLTPGMGGGSGPVSMYGPDLSEWPSIAVDAMELYYQEDYKYKRRLYEADNPPAK